MNFTKLLIALSLTTLLLQGCVEDDLGFPKEDPVDLSTSPAVYMYLNSLENSNASCFELIYPVSIGYNNGIIITIENREGLLEALNSQRSSFHISSIQFPFLVDRGGELHSIEDEAGFISLLASCELPTLRNRFDKTLNQCYELIYPLKLVDGDDNEVPITNDAALKDFLEVSGNTYQPLFVYPISLRRFSADQEESIANLYELFQLLNTCVGCPDVSFTYDDITDFRYRFEAEISNEVTSFDWYVNDRLVKSGNPEDLLLEETFSPGSYKVCIKATTDFCNQGVIYCKELFIESKCPELHFEPVQGEVNSVYTFFAEFPSMNDLASYSWVINGDVVEVEQGDTRDDQLFWQFGTGIYEVCLEFESPQCPEGTEYCEEIAAGCLPLDFSYEEETYGYVLSPDFDGAHLVTYIWKVFVNDTLIEEVVHEPGQEEDDFVLDELEPGVTYEVCLKQDGPCLEQQVCKTFTW